MRSIVTLASIALFAALVTGCATRHPVPAVQYSQPGYGSQYGVVQNIETVRAQSQTSGGGAVVGGVVGGLLGHQVDHGGRKDFATGVGIVAGALIGNEIEKNNRGVRDVYRVTVQIERGGLRTFDYASLNDLRVGDRVRIENNQLYRW